jgi:Zn-dependent protease with chaperone function
MSAELTDVPAERQPGAEAGTSSGSLALPVSTSFRFSLLIAAVVASSFFVYEGVYLATARGSAIVSLMRRCRSLALAQHPTGLIAYASALHQAAICYSGAERTEAWWGLLGVGVLIVAAGAIFLIQPWWYRRRMHLSRLAGADADDLISRLEAVRLRAGTDPVTWLFQPLNVRLSAFAYGRPGRRFVAVSGGAAVAAVRKPAAFDAVIFHELAHIKNRDIDQTYLALAIWRAFVVAALLPMAILLIFTRELGEPQRVIWRAAVMALIVYLLRNAILRSREFDADARVLEFDPETDLGSVLAALPTRAGRRLLHLGWTHPSGQERAAALREPAPLYRFGFWDGLAIGLIAALGASAAEEIVTLLTTTFGVTLAAPAIIFGAFAGPAIAVAVWRAQRVAEYPGQVKGWAAGLGLGLGLALGPVVALSAALSQALAPDDLDLAAFGVLAVWIVLAVLIFTAFPVWVGHWANAWQGTGDARASRRLGRAGMVAAAISAWVVMAFGLYLLLENSTIILGESSATAEWQQLPELVRDTAVVVVLAASSWVAWLVVLAVPLAAAVVQHRWRRPGDTADAAVRRRGWLAAALLCFASCVVAVALMLGISAVAHAHIAEVVRWSPQFLVRLVTFDEQAIVVIAVVCALILAARARSAVGLALSVAAGAAVAAVCGLALPSVVTMDHCFASLSIEYAHPPAGSCFTSPDALAVREVVVGAALVSILIVPAAYAAGLLWRRRTPRRRRQVSVVVLGWLTATAAAIAAIAVTAIWAPGASAQGVRAAGSIGNDGWIRGYSYDVRLIPNWYAVTDASKPELIYLNFPTDGAVIRLESLVGVNPLDVAADESYVRRLGARPSKLDGASGLLVSRSGLPNGILALRLVVRGPVVYVLTLYRSSAFPQDSPYLRSAFASMLQSWRWSGSV